MWLADMPHTSSAPAWASHGLFNGRRDSCKICSLHYLVPHSGPQSYRQKHLWHKRHPAMDEMQRVIYVQRSNICLNVACSQADRVKHCPQDPPRPPAGPHSSLLASVGILYRRENTFSKEPGPVSLPCTDHWITFSLSFGCQGHMSSVHCAAGTWRSCQSPLAWL